MLKKALIVCTTLMFVTLAGCKDKTHVVEEKPEETTTAAVTEDSKYTRPDYKKDGKETKAKINETVNWNDTGAEFTLKSVGFTEQIDNISYIIFDIEVKNNSERTINLSLLDDEIVLFYNGSTQIAYGYKDYVKALSAAQNYFTVDASDNYLYNAGTDYHLYLPIKKPLNLGAEVKIALFPDYTGSPDYVTFTVGKDEIKQLSPL